MLYNTVIITIQWAASMQLAKGRKESFPQWLGQLRQLGKSSKKTGGKCYFFAPGWGEGARSHSLGNFFALCMSYGSLNVLRKP